MKKQWVMLANGETGDLTIECPAFVIGQLCVHKRIDDNLAPTTAREWKVSHVPTGMGMMGEGVTFRTKGGAIEAVKAAAAAIEKKGVDVSSTDPALCVKIPEMKAAYKFLRKAAEFERWYAVEKIAGIFWAERRDIADLLAAI